MPEEMQVPPLEPRHRLLLLGPGPFAASPPTPKAAAAPAARRPWEGAGEEEWYSRSMQFWAQQEVSCSGVLGGRPDTHLPDLHASEAFLDGVLRQRQTRLQTALDCGAGVGRLAEALLLPRVETVDLLEPSGALLEASGGWVLLYLTDADLVAVLRRLRKALRPGGCLVVKENVLLNRLVHERDSSLTRTDGHFRRLFAEAQLTLRCSAAQEPWPSELLPAPRRGWQGDDVRSGVTPKLSVARFNKKKLVPLAHAGALAPERQFSVVHFPPRTSWRRTNWVLSSATGNAWNAAEFKEAARWWCFLSRLQQKNHVKGRLACKAA
ncbi:unnamed protein product [Effrenium voratum]|nr:unnamed protein product [Effrenium voratum]